MSVALAFLALAACSTDSTGNNPPPNSDVLIVPGASTMGAAAYDPNPFTISLATQTTVEWGNDDGITHTVTADGGTFSSGNLGAGATFSHTFAAPGTFPYHCALHPTMVGTVIITP
jgi:plastocyanin